MPTQKKKTPAESIQLNLKRVQYTIKREFKVLEPRVRPIYQGFTNWII